MPKEARSIIADFLPARETQRVDRAGRLLTAHRILDLRCDARCEPWLNRRDFERGQVCLTWRSAQPLPGTVATSREGCLRVARPLVVAAELRELASRGSQEGQRWLAQVKQLLLRTPAQKRLLYDISDSGILDAAFFEDSLSDLSFDGGRLLRWGEKNKGEQGDDELLQRWCRIAHARSKEAFAHYFRNDCLEVNDVALVKRTARRLAVLFPRKFSYLPPELRSDTEVAEAAVRQRGEMLESLPTELRANRAVVKAAVRQNGLALQHAAVELRGDRALVEAAVRQNGLALQHASPELRGDRALAEAAVRRRGAAFEHASAELRSDPSLLELALRDRRWSNAHRHALGAASVDKALAMEALRRHVGFFQDFAPELRGDEEVAHAAVMHDADDYLHVLAPAKSKELLRHALATEPNLFYRLSPAERGDRDVALAALTADPRTFSEASAALKDDEAFALEAVRLRPENFEHAGPRARDDLDAARLAVAGNPRLFRVAGETARNDPALALTAMHSGVPLSFAGPAARNDPRVVLAALRRDSRALPHAGPDVRNNKQVVLRALRGTSDRATRDAVGPAARHDGDVAEVLKR